MDIITDIIIPVTSVIISALVAYLVAERALHSEQKKGRVLLQTLAQRYFISFLNSFDQSTQTIKDDALTKAQYVAELDSIISDFSLLSTNIFYQRTLDKSPHLIKCLVQARRELVEHGTSGNFKLNTGTAKDFAALYRESRKGNKNRLPIEDVIESVEKS